MSVDVPRSSLVSGGSTVVGIVHFVYVSIVLEALNHLHSIHSQGCLWQCKSHNTLQIQHMTVHSTLQAQGNNIEPK